MKLPKIRAIKQTIMGKILMNMIKIPISFSSRYNRFNVGECQYLLYTPNSAYTCPELRSTLQLMVDTWPIHCQSASCNLYEYAKCVEENVGYINEILRKDDKMYKYCL